MRRAVVVLALLALVAVVYTAAAHPVGWGGYGRGMHKGMIGHEYAPCHEYGYLNGQNAGNNTEPNRDIYWHCPMWRWFSQNVKTNNGWYCPMWNWINQIPGGS